METAPIRDLTEYAMQILPSILDHKVPISVIRERFNRALIHAYVTGAKDVITILQLQNQSHDQDNPPEEGSQV